MKHPHTWGQVRGLVSEGLCVGGAGATRPAPLECKLLRIETVGALVNSAVDGRVGLLPLPVAAERAERCQEEEDQDQNDDPAVHGFLRAGPTLGVPRYPDY